MPAHREQRLLPYTPEQLFALVADIEKYPDFLPWCVQARVREKTPQRIVADLSIGYKIFRERFTSEVHLDPSHKITVAYRDGPFKYLHNTWEFREQGNGQTLLDFAVDFEFRSSLMEKAIQAVFSRAVEKMVQSFDQRAQSLYEPR